MVSNIITDLLHEPLIQNNKVEIIHTHVKFKEMTKFGQFAIKVLIHRVESFLQFLLVQLANGIMGRIVVDVGKENGLRECGFDVYTRAPVTMPARPNLEIEVINISVLETQPDAVLTL